MIHAKVGFVVYGVHKDGLLDPMGVPFIDDSIVERSKQALKDAGLTLVENNLIVATKAEAREVILPLAKDDSIDALVLFSATWVWSAHMIQAIREFAKTGKGIVIWTYPGSQGWRPVGGLVLKAALSEIGIPYRYVYGKCEDKKDLDRIVSYCQAYHRCADHRGHALLHLIYYYSPGAQRGNGVAEMRFYRDRCLNHQSQIAGCTDRSAGRKDSDAG